MNPYNRHLINIIEDKDFYDPEILNLIVKKIDKEELNHTIYNIPHQRGSLVTGNFFAFLENKKKYHKQYIELVETHLIDLNIPKEIKYYLKKETISQNFIDIFLYDKYQNINELNNNEEKLILNYIKDETISIYNKNLFNLFINQKDYCISHNLFFNKKIQTHFNQLSLEEKKQLIDKKNYSQLLEQYLKKNNNFKIEPILDCIDSHEIINFYEKNLGSFDYINWFQKNINKSLAQYVQKAPTLELIYNNNRKHLLCKTTNKSSYNHIKDTILIMSKIKNDISITQKQLSYFFINIMEFNNIQLYKMVRKDFNLPNDNNFDLYMKNKVKIGIDRIEDIEKIIIKEKLDQSLSEKIQSNKIKI